jgi:hypothetical protein
MRVPWSEGGDTVHIVPRKLRRLLASSPPAQPAGPPIQAREQEAAKERLLAQVHRMRNERSYGRPAR